MGKDLLALLHDLRERTDTSLGVKKKKRQWEIFVPHSWISPILDNTEKMENVFVNCFSTYSCERKTGVKTLIGGESFT